MNQLPIENNQYLPKEGGQYFVNEIFYSVQGEGRLAGTPMAFLRFGKCNLRCSIKNSGFNCDTEFESGRYISTEEILSELNNLNAPKGWLLVTGGEPALQVTQELVNTLKQNGWKIAIETNGTIKLPEGIDWICVSPKSAEHTIKQRTANEV